MSDQIHELSRLNGVAVEVGDNAILSTSVVDSEEKKDELMNVLSSYRNRKFSITQLHTADKEWGIVGELHRILFSEIDSGKILHLSTPLNPVLFFGPEPKYIDSERIILDRLPHLINMESWVHYCEIYNDLLEQKFQKFIPDAVEEYTLEGHLKHFRHEVHSSLLKQALERIALLFAQMNEVSGYRELVELEKELVRSREELFVGIESHYKVLIDITETIQVIEEMHPELLDIKRIGILLMHLLSKQVQEESQISWVQEQMLIELVNQELALTSVIMGENSGGRTKVALALRWAILSLVLSDGKDVVIEMVLHYEEGSHPLIQKLQAVFVENLQDLSGISSPSEQFKENDFRVNPEILSLFSNQMDPNEIKNLIFV